MQLHINTHTHTDSGEWSQARDSHTHTLGRQIIAYTLMNPTGLVRGSLERQLVLQLLLLLLPLDSYWTATAAYRGEQARVNDERKQTT